MRYRQVLLSLTAFAVVVGGLMYVDPRVSSRFTQLIIGIFTEWALILVTAAIGSAYLLNLFMLDPTLEILIGAGLFIVGALTQVVIMQSQKHAER